MDTALPPPIEYMTLIADDGAAGLEAGLRPREATDQGERAG